MIHSFIHSFIQTFIHLVIYPSIHLLIHAFIRSSISIHGRSSIHFMFFSSLSLLSRGWTPLPLPFIFPVIFLFFSHIPFYFPFPFPYQIYQEVPENRFFPIAPIGKRFKVPQLGFLWSQCKGSPIHINKRTDEIRK